MQFFARVRDAMARFMYGRNGVDQLNIAMLWVSIGAEFTNRSLRRSGGPLGGKRWPPPAGGPWLSLWESCHRR